mgnify:FL=1
MARPVSDRERQIAEELGNLERVAKLAEDLGKPGDAVKAIQRTGVLRAELSRLQAVRKAAAISDPVARLRRLADVAAGDGSWVASKDFQREAARLELEREIAKREADAAELLNQNDEQLWLLMAEIVPQLTRAQAIALGRAILARDDLGLDDIVEEE